MLIKNIVRGYLHESSNVVLLLYRTTFLLSSADVFGESMTGVNTTYSGVNNFGLLFIAKLYNHCTVYCLGLERQIEKIKFEKRVFLSLQNILIR